MLVTPPSPETPYAMPMLTIALSTTACKTVANKKLILFKQLQQRLSAQILHQVKARKHTSCFQLKSIWSSGAVFVMPSIIFLSSTTVVVSFASVNIVLFFRLIIKNISCKGKQTQAVNWCARNYLDSKLWIVNCVVGKPPPPKPLINSQIDWISY